MGSIRSQIGQPQIFQNWRRTLVFTIWGGLVIGGRDYFFDPSPSGWIGSQIQTFWSLQESHSLCLAWLGWLDVVRHPSLDVFYMAWRWKRAGLHKDSERWVRTQNWWILCSCRVFDRNTRTIWTISSSCKRCRCPLLRKVTSKQINIYFRSISMIPMKCEGRLFLK